MPQNRASGPQIGQTVIYTETSSTFYPAIIVAVNSDGTVRLTAFPAGGTTTDQNNKKNDANGTVSGTWRYPDQVSGI
jgi:hypothetical protein